SFKEFHALKGGKGAKLVDYACDFLHRRIVLGFAALATELRKILDRQTVPAVSIKALNKVCERTVNRTEQTMDRHLDADHGCHPHGQILVFGQFREVEALRFEYVMAAAIHYLEASCRNAQHSAKFQLQPLDRHFAGAVDSLLPLLLRGEFEWRQGRQVSTQ